MVKFRFTRQLSCPYHSVSRNRPCAEGWPLDSVYWDTMPRSALANPTFVLFGFAASLLKLKLPLKLDERAAGLVVCSTNTPAFRLCAPFIFVRFPEMLNSVL